MILLALETASYQEASAALFAPDSGFCQKTFPMGRDLSSLLMPEIEKMTCGRVPDVIAVDRGPGSFTGIRTGLAAAQGLALGWGSKLVGVSRFDFYPMNGKEGEELLLLDAKAGGGFYFEYRTKGRREAGFCKKEELSVRFPEILSYYGECDENTFPGKRFVSVRNDFDARSLAELAMDKMRRGEELPTGALYLHLRAVIPNKKL
ncbi:tRNA (adenosine(37)-N6)-threonylcarbamoyltransferase complex dimerization subunit type 1 TsaB [bacterium]|nr:tRNA (adenosine(37)-N6)-threonylcarbamoyltransferase complex dimerization subunit type 1 TsaB [bacterium]